LPDGQYLDERGGRTVKITIALLAGAGALFTGSANAADFYTTSEYLDSKRSGRAADSHGLR
jgi:hypothetical protein